MCEIKRLSEICENVVSELLFICASFDALDTTDEFCRFTKHFELIKIARLSCLDSPNFV